MVDFNSDEAEFELNEDWRAELERRVSNIENGTSNLKSWEAVRDEALRRIGQADGH